MAIETEKVPKAGAIAPEFELPDSEGQLRRLSELTASRPLGLIFFRGHW
jgi:peroxiredoxin